MDWTRQSIFYDWLVDVIVERRKNPRHEEEKILSVVWGLFEDREIEVTFPDRTGLVITLREFDLGPTGGE